MLHGCFQRNYFTCLEVDNLGVISRRQDRLLQFWFDLRKLELQKKRMKGELKPRGRGVARTGLFNAEKKRVGSGGKDRENTQRGRGGGVGQGDPNGNEKHWCGMWTSDVECHDGAITVTNQLKVQLDPDQFTTVCTKSSSQPAKCQPVGGRVVVVAIVVFLMIDPSLVGACTCVMSCHATSKDMTSHNFCHNSNICFFSR